LNKFFWIPACVGMTMNGAANPASICLAQAGAQWATKATPARGVAWG